MPGVFLLVKFLNGVILLVENAWLVAVVIRGYVTKSVDRDNTLSQLDKREFERREDEGSCLPKLRTHSGAPPPFALLDQSFFAGLSVVECSLAPRCGCRQMSKNGVPKTP